MKNIIFIFLAVIVFYSCKNSENEVKPKIEKRLFADTENQIKKYSERKGYQFACETAVYLDQDQLSKGLGTKLKKSVIQYCKDLGYKHLVAKIQADNEVSVHYNERLGYEIVGTQKRIGFANGKWKDVVIMQLLLD